MKDCITAGNMHWVFNLFINIVGIVQMIGSYIVSFVSGNPQQIACAQQLLNQKIEVGVLITTIFSI